MKGGCDLLLVFNCCYLVSSDYRTPTKLREGKVFSHLYLSVSVHRGVPMWPLPICLSDHVVCQYNNTEINVKNSHNSLSTDWHDVQNSPLLLAKFVYGASPIIVETTPQVRVKVIAGRLTKLQ